MNIALVVIISLSVLLLLGIGIYYFYYYAPYNFIGKKYAISVLYDETEFDNTFSKSIPIKTLVTRSSLSVPNTGYGLTFAWEMYIPNRSSNDNWNNKFNIVKPIIAMNDSPQIGYNPKKNYLSIILKYRDNPFYSQYSEMKIPDIKQQKWNKYILIINGRNISIFINGSLIDSSILPSLPVIYDIAANIDLGNENNNFLGKIRNLVMYPLPIDTIDIDKI